MARPLSDGRGARGRGVRTVRCLLAVTATLVGLVVLGAVAGAHSGIQSYVYVSFSDSEVDGRVEYPVDDLGAVLGLEFPSDRAGIREVALANADEIRAYTAEHVALGDAEGEWELSFTDDPTVLPAAGGYVQVRFEVVRSFDAAPRSFRVDYDGILHANPERDALFIVENDWGTARFNNEGDFLVGFSVGLTSQQIELEDVSTLESIGAARGLGTDAIREGADLVLFVVALLVPVALVPVAGRISGPAPGLAPAARRAGTLLAVHLAAGSVVLWVMALASIEWSDDLVGPLLAASLLVMAVYAIWRFTERERLVVAVLGAMQGVGYAHAYDFVRLDRVDNPLTVLAFNLGVVVGVVTVAVLVFPLLLLLRRTAIATALFYGLSGVLAAYGVAWLVERAAGVDLSVNRVATPLEVWPRNLVLMLVAWALAGALYAWTAHRDALRPVEGADRTPDDDRSVVMS